MLVVLDANVLVSAAISPRGVPARIVGEWLDGAFDLIVSPKLLEEVGRNLRGDRLRGKVSGERVEQVLEQLRDHAIVADYPVDVEPVVAGDPKDDFVVALARVAGASVIVTGDRHLLEVAGLEPSAIRPREFLAILLRHLR